MLGYDFEIIHKNGKQNMVEDALSRKYEDVEALLCDISIIQPDWILEVREEWKHDPSVWTLIQQQQKVFHKLRALTIPKHFPLFPKGTPFTLLHPINGKSIKWMPNLPSCMETCMIKFTCNNLQVLSKMTLVLFVAIRNIFMVLSKPLMLGNI